jgi:magnesium transporter
MLYLTQILGKTVLHPDGERFGRIAEVVVTPGEPLPTVAAYQVKTTDGAVFLPAEAFPISGGEAREYTLKRPVTEIPPYHIQANDFSLVRDVLDKQIVDVEDYRVVRVNDIRLERVPGGNLALFGVDRRRGRENRQGAASDPVGGPAHRLGERGILADA